MWNIVFLANTLSRTKYTGVIKWDPFLGGIEQAVDVRMMILRDFQCDSVVLFGFGNIMNPVYYVLLNDEQMSNAGSQFL